MDTPVIPEQSEDTSTSLQLPVNIQNTVETPHHPLSTSMPSPVVESPPYVESEEIPLLPDVALSPRDGINRMSMGEELLMSLHNKVRFKLYITV